jgi:hypothetical protein
LERVAALTLYFAKEMKKDRDEFVAKYPKIDVDDKTLIEDADDKEVIKSNLNKLIRKKLDQNNKKLGKIEEANSEDYDLTPNISRQEKSVTNNLSESRNTSQIINAGFGQIMDLFKKKDMTNSTSYVITFILSLSDSQLMMLNEAMMLNRPKSDSTIRQFDLNFRRMLSKFQYDLFEKSRIWCLPKESYLEPKKLSSSLSKEDRRRYINHMDIHPRDLLIMEHSPQYNKELLNQEAEQEKEFLSMINANNGQEILDRLHKEQLRIFEN